MHLPTMVNLVLKQVHQQAIASFNLDTRASIDPHLAGQQGRCQRVADTDQTLVHRRLSPRKLCNSWKRNWIFKGRRSKPSALKCINVKKINTINVVQRCLQTREEARARGLKFALGQFGARAQQAVVRSRIVVGEGAMGLNKPDTHCNFLN
jgi:hypothetical protein